jgi:predicted DsbA family dithiol-disulfide isomerase
MSTAPFSSNTNRAHRTRWYKKSRYGDSEDKMEMYMKLMTSYGATAGISYKFHGTVANTLQAHRVIYNIQEAHGSNTTNLLISSLYKQYFENEQHPSNKETLMKACADAGVDEKEAKTLVDDEYEGLMDVKNLIREQISNGVDSVPYVVVEGKRRDVEVQGAQEVEDYVKALVSVIKESV